MIERMHKATVVCLAEDREASVERLRDLASVHVVPVTLPASDELEMLLRQRETLDRARRILETVAADDAPAAASAVAPELPDAVPAVATAVLEAVAARDAAAERIRQLARMADQLAPWGSFSQEDLASLRQAGLHVTLCSWPESSPPVLPAGAVVRTMRREGGTVHAAVITTEAVDETLPAVPLPEMTDRAAIRAESQSLAAAIARHDAFLHAGAERLGDLEAAALQQEDAIAYARARDGMGAADGLVYLQGYVPEGALGALRAAAPDAGWALRLEAADPDDPKVPTRLIPWRPARLAQAIFDFVGVLPAYREVDVSPSVLLFLTLFFGMIVGDAGYGALFLAAALVLRRRCRRPDQRRFVNLFLLFSVVTILWGGLSGNWFAIPADCLPRPLRGIRWLTDAESKDRHVQWLCFVVAAVHLSLARLWQAMLHAGSRQALGHVGWALFLWGNFFTAVELVVRKGSFPGFAFGLYGVGLVLILVWGANWRDMGEVMNLPFSFIGSFVDVLSYIRLFAVGLSSFFIADSFNRMGGMLFKASPWLLPATALVIVFGHGLNIALEFMGVLVHGVRLNTLEFSNHMALTWSGRSYAPLRRQHTTLQSDHGQGAR